MPEWLMKISDHEYVIWSTVVDSIMEGPMNRDDAVKNYGFNRVLRTDAHLCSCATPAYHFDSYEDVAAFMDVAR